MRLLRASFAVLVLLSAAAALAGDDEMTCGREMAGIDTPAICGPDLITDRRGKELI